AFDDGEILDLATAERRVLLTRDAALYRSARKRGVTAVFVESGAIVEQLKQMIGALEVHLYNTPFFSRCPVCNGELKETEKEKLEGEFPENVLTGAREFWRCADCGKIYWEGRHWENIRKMIEEVRSDV
ncbi:MAG: Mut7-C RNAse domain-containing protein, partial [Candidatus Hydrothermarchaeota archaeon]|nr:Mut7-C RNAse domain-containing protein [Candidatus Hydrothermarchaeota archaeon]